jgi:hypothetical protein
MSPFLQSIRPETFVSPRWVMAPLPNGKWLLVLSGIVTNAFQVVVTEALEGHEPTGGNDSVQIYPDTDIATACATVPPSRFTPPLEAPFRLSFLVEQIAMSGNLSSIQTTIKTPSLGVKFAVNNTLPILDGDMLRGIQLEIEVQGGGVGETDIWSVGYHITAVGSVVHEPLGTEGGERPRPTRI